MRSSFAELMLSYVHRKHVYIENNHAIGGLYGVACMFVKFGSVYDVVCMFVQFSLIVTRENHLWKPRWKVLVALALPCVFTLAPRWFVRLYLIFVVALA